MRYENNKTKINSPLFPLFGAEPYLRERQMGLYNRRKFERLYSKRYTVFSSCGGLLEKITNNLKITIMATIKIYRGNGINEGRTNCKDSYLYSELSIAIADFISEFNEISKFNTTEENYRIESEINPDYEFKQNELFHLELQKFDEDGDIVDWNEVEFENVSKELLDEFKNIVGANLSGWLQSVDFIML